MKQFFTGIALFLYMSITSAQNTYFTIYTDSLQLKKDNNTLIEDFEKRVQQINPKISFRGMETKILSGAPVGSYLAKPNKIFLPYWPTMPEMFKNFGEGLTGSKQGGDQLAGLFYYGYFLPHEIAHGLQFNAQKRHDNEYDNEYEANVLALLYWRKIGKTTELEACYKMAKAILKKMTNPIPEKEDTKEYFTAHYDEFVQDPNKYGYIMFHQIVTAFEDKSLPDFDKYIAKILQRK